MDFEIFIESLLKFINGCDNAYFVMYAAATCIITQIAKKLFVDKVKVDVLHKFDFAVLLPFIIGAGFAAIDVIFVRKAQCFTFNIILDVVINSVAIGALSSTIFKLVSSVSGGKLSSLMTDDVFGMFYTQLLYYGNVRSQLTDKTLTFEQFVNEVKLVAANAVGIYQTDLDEDGKRQRLAQLLTGIIDDNSVNTCVSALNKALINYVDKPGKPKQAKKDTK